MAAVLLVLAACGTSPGATGPTSSTAEQTSATIESTTTTTTTVTSPSTEVVRITEARSALARVAVPASEAPAAAAAVNRFGLALLRPQLGTAKGNVAMSPWSIATALHMARAGATGQTAVEMDALLGITDPAAAHRRMNALDADLATRNGTFDKDGEQRVVELAAANRLFAQAGLSMEQAFLDLLASSYGADVGLVDYRSAAEEARARINGWVAERTKQRIPELLKKDALDALTRLVLVNAVYLHADWERPSTGRSVGRSTLPAATSRP